MLEKLPRTVEEFEQLIRDEDACVAVVRRCRWPDGFVCPKCGGRESWQLRARRLDECRRCGHQTSLTAGTVFARTRKPLRFWFRVFADVLLSKGGCSALEVSRRHGITYRTAWTWLHKMRALMRQDGVRPLADRVEAIWMDKPASRFAQRPFVAVEKHDDGCGRLRATRGTTIGEFADFVTRNCEPLTMVKTAAITGLGAELRKAKLIPYTVPLPRLDVPRARCVLTHVRRHTLGTYHGAFRRRYARRYVDEFVFRFNRRTSKNRWLLVRRLLEASAQRVPTLRELRAGT